MGRKMKVYRKAGDVIHIGEWDHLYSEKLNPDYDMMSDAEKRAMIEAGHDPEFLYNDNGERIMVDLNPIPPGVMVADEMVQTLPDGSRAVASDYRRKRQAEYPSLPDQLDMIYHDRVNGTDHWFQTIEAVKRKYPKTV